MQLELWDLKFVVRRTDKIWQVMCKELSNKYNKNCNTHYWIGQTTGFFLVVRLMPQEGAAWGVGFEIHGWRECMKMTGQEQ